MKHHDSATGRFDPWPTEDPQWKGQKIVSRAILGYPYRSPTIPNHFQYA